MPDWRASARHRDILSSRNSSMQLLNAVVNEEEKLSAVLQVVCGQLNDPAAGRAFEPMVDRRLRAAPEPKESVE